VWKWKLGITAAAFLAYLPAVNNGFIADDFVILHRIDILKTDPFHLWEIVPENFRLTSYAVFGTLKAVFGYDYRFYYLFNILLHELNCVLLQRVVADITEDVQLANLSALLFAVFQAPQEAVMWLAAMNETLLGLFLLLTMMLWTRRSYAGAAVTFLLALLSKESALVFLLFVPVLDWWRGHKPERHAYVMLAVPAVLFTGLFVWTLSLNFQVGSGTYALGPHAGLVLLNSFHHLIWPWSGGYLLGIGLFAVKRTQVNWNSVAILLALSAILMLPYVFVTYTNNVPSRQVYLASMTLLPLLAAAMIRINVRGIATLFVLFNVGYMWMVKDAQMLERAIPTTRLIETLKGLKPARLRVLEFAYPIKLIEKGAAVTIPGWNWDQVEPFGPCADCTVLKWNSAERRYAVIKVAGEDAAE
jgi:hypothetical protein